jgi:RNA polymerase subunit RPABC4/transcription elongation factor Spt4
MDLAQILDTIQPFVVMFVALTAAFLTAIWISAVIWTFRDIRSRSRDVFAQVLATLMVFIFFPLFPLPGMILYLILRPRETLAEIYERTLEEEALLQGIEERLACPSCNRRIEEDYVVCPSCHTRLKKGCISCGRMLHLSWAICAYCGAAQTTSQTVLPPQPVVETAALPVSAPSSLPEPQAEFEVESEDQAEVESEDQADLMAEEDFPASEAQEESEAEVEPWGTEAESTTLDQEVEPEIEPEPELEAEDDQAPEPDAGDASEPEEDDSGSA